jgi:hypothetical protein
LCEAVLWQCGGLFHDHVEGVTQCLPSGLMFRAPNQGSENPTPQLFEVAEDHVFLVSEVAEEAGP